MCWQCILLMCSDFFPWEQTCTWGDLKPQPHKGSKTCKCFIHYTTSHPIYCTHHMSHIIVLGNITSHVWTFSFVYHKLGLISLAYLPYSTLNIYNGRYYIKHICICFFLNVEITHLCSTKSLEKRISDGHHRPGSSKMTNCGPGLG